MRTVGPRTRDHAAAILALVLLAGCAGGQAPGGTESLLRQGKDHLGARRFDDAIGRLQEVVVQDPGSATAYVYLARAHGAKKEWAEAIVAARKAFDLAPSSPETSAALTASLLRGGVDSMARKQYAEAVTRLGDYVTLKPDVPGFLGLGQAAVEAGAWETALDAFRRGLELSAEGSERDELIDALLDGGDRALMKRQPAAAVAFLEEYVRIDQFNVYAYRRLGKAYRESGNRPSAAGAFRRVLELNPRDTEALRSVRDLQG